MKEKVVIAPRLEHRVWCGQCYIRIAPTEEQVTRSGKTYHARCMVKVKVVPVRARAARAAK